MKCKRQKDRVAIVGKSPLTRDLAPFNDTRYELWGSNDIYNYIPRVDVLFQLHERKRFEVFYRDKDHLAFLQNCGLPVFTYRKYEDIPTSIAYPWDELINKYGDYFTNSISEMIALALHMKYKQIELYGIDLLTEREEITQLGSICYFIGIAKGLKIHRGYPLMYIPPESPLLKAVFIYGREGSTSLFDRILDDKYNYNKMMNHYEKEELKYRDLKNQSLGAKSMSEKILAYKEIG